MKANILIAALLLFSTAAIAQEKIYCVTACPGEDASTQINISWAADTTAADTYLLVCENGKKPLLYRPEQHLCSEFKGLPSASPKGEKIYEDAEFLKCKVCLTGLKPDTQYYYAVGSGSDKDIRKSRVLKKKGCTGDVHSFKTAGASEWSACIISDFHSYTPLPKRLESAMNMVGKVEEFDGSIDWVLHLGDICAWGGSHSFWRELYRQDKFKNYMWAGVNGNHDNMSRGYEKQSGAFFRDNAAYPLNGYGDQQGVCYWFRYNNAMFIMLNSEVMRDYVGLHDAQDWVRKVVAEQKASDNPPTYIIVCEHYQWFFAESGATSQYERWHELFDELGVDLALAGNNHIYARTHAIFDSEVTDGTSGTVYFQTASADNERGQGLRDVPMKNSDKIAYRWTEGDNTVSAVDMKVTDQKITLTLLDRNGTRLDQAVVLAKKDKKLKEDVLGNYLRDSLAAMTKRCEKTIKAAYMAENKLGTRYDVPGWEGFPVEYWEYHTGVDCNINAPKRGTVLMLNPTAEKLAKWIINAVYDVKGTIEYADLEKVRTYITWQSGAQFPVRGVVYEAMYKPGDYYPYIFKDGITVYMKNEALHKAADNNPSDELLDFYTNEMTNDDLKDYTGRYARISSTTREMYYKAGGTDKVGQSADGQRDLAYLNTVAKNYQKAWNSNHNFLIYAWALSNLQ